MFSTAYPVTRGRQCAGLDIFCRDLAAWTWHLRSQLSHHRCGLQSSWGTGRACCRAGLGDRQTFLNLFCTESQLAGGARRECDLLLGPDNRTVNSISNRLHFSQNF